jgi:Ca2+-binding EF-hand superfamily protein
MALALSPMKGSRATRFAEAKKEEEMAALLRQTGFKAEDVALLTKMFDFYDADRDGMLTEQQAALLCRTAGFHPVEPSLLRSENGRMNLEAVLLCAGFVRSREMAVRDRRNATKHFFRMMQRRSHDKALPAADFHRFFRSIGLGLQPAAVERIAEAISADGEPEFHEQDLVTYIENTWRTLSKQDPSLLRSPMTEHSNSGAMPTNRSEFNTGRSKLTLTARGAKPAAHCN